MGSVDDYTVAAGTRYRVRYRRLDRTQVQKSGFLTRRDALDYLALTEAMLMTGVYRDPASARITIGSLGVPWLDAQIQLKPSWFAVLAVAWRVHVEPRWGNVFLRDVRFSDVQRWVVGLAADKSATTVIRAHGVLAGILEFAFRDRRIDDNPARGVHLPRKPLRLHPYLTHAQVNMFAEECGEWALVVNLLAYTGMRWGELIALRVDCFDRESERLRIQANAVRVQGFVHLGSPKSHAIRSVPYPEFLSFALVDACNGRSAHQLIFGNGFNYLTVPQKNGWFARAKERTIRRDPSFPAHLTMHDLRHTAASLAISAGANVKAVQRMLGHASAVMTLDVYADLFESDLTEVARRLDERRTLALHSKRA